jgi:hypothetical protein
MDAPAPVGTAALPVITVITPTADRPLAWPLLERWMRAQTVRPDQWIVADDGVGPAPLTMGQTHIRSERRETGAESLAMNLLAAMPHVTGDVVVIAEDDDGYLPNHIEVCVNRLKRHKIVGARWMRYYNVRVKGWRRIPNACATLSNTAFRRECLHDFEWACKEAMRLGIYHIDRLLWQRVGHAGLHDEETVVGMKGLPGTPGIGIGHKTDAPWIKDPQGAKLREWMGSDADHYLRLNDGA